MDRIRTIVPAALLAGAVAVMGFAFAPGAVVPAQAFSCGLSANDSDATINTVAGADSASANTRIACGPNATATGGNATAIGNIVVASGFNSSALGSFAHAAGDRSTAVGNSAASLSGTAQGYTAVGAQAGAGHTLGLFSTTIGAANANAFSPGATGDYSIAIGGGTDGNPGAVAGGAAGNNHTIAIGTGAVAGADASGQAGALALGGKSKAKAAQSVALGHRSVANKANTVSVGAKNRERRIMNLAKGKKATDAVNLGQMKTFVNKATDAAAAQAASASELEVLRRELAAMRELVEVQTALVERQRQRIDALEGGAALAALAM